jgi:hypothetical protein
MSRETQSRQLNFMVTNRPDEQADAMGIAADQIKKTGPSR